MSTIGSKTIKAIAAELAKNNITVLDSPVSGGPRGARAGTLATMVSGDRAAFDRAKPLLDTLARNVFYMGPQPGLAQVTKVANNMISAAGMVASFEVAALAVKGRVPVPGRGARSQSSDVAWLAGRSDVVPGHGRRPRQRRLHLADQSDRDLGQCRGRRE